MQDGVVGEEVEEKERRRGGGEKVGDGVEGKDRRGGEVGGGLGFNMEWKEMSGWRERRGKGKGKTGGVGWGGWGGHT